MKKGLNFGKDMDQNSNCNSTSIVLNLRQILGTLYRSRNPSSYNQRHRMVHRHEERLVLSQKLGWVCFCKEFFQILFLDEWREVAERLSSDKSFQILIYCILDKTYNTSPIFNYFGFVVEITQKKIINRSCCNFSCTYGLTEGRRIHYISGKI